MRFPIAQSLTAMENPKKHLVDRILSFRKQRRTNLGVVPYISTIGKTHEQKNIDSFKKGTEFEAFVVKKFDPEYFTLIEWRSDKNVDDIFPLMSKFPDLELYYESKSECKYFAVECKWRECFSNGRIFLDKFQLENYRHYESVMGNLTFLVIGIGNTPGNPNQVYIVPLKAITNEILHEFELEIYRRKNPHDMFFLSCCGESLR